MTVRATSNDLAALHRLCQGEALKARMLRAASGEGLRLNQLGFRDGTDPTGDPWAPLKSRVGVILVKTARMRNSFTSRPTPTGFVIGSNDEKVKWHQDGTNGRENSETRHMTMPYFSDFMQVSKYGKLGTKRGQFMSRKTAARIKGSVATKSFSMTFGVGSGAIPARPMVPTGGVLTAKWQAAIDSTCNGVMKKSVAEAGGK